MERSIFRHAGEVGLVNSRRTGDMARDIAFAVSVPILMKACTDALTYGGPLALSYMHRAYLSLQRQDRFYRCIEYERMMSQLGSEDDTAEEARRNNILQKAILLYMSQLGVRYTNAQLMLSAVKETGTRVPTDTITGRSKTVYGGTAEQLRAYSVGTAPPKGHWVPLMDGILFRMSTSVVIEGGERHGSSASHTKKTVKHEFVCVRSDGDVRIKRFIEKAFSWYLMKMESTEDQSRYLFNLQSPDERSAGVTLGGGTGDLFQDPMAAVMRGNKRNGHPVNRGRIHWYKRYKLGNVKDFDTLFFPEKPNLLRILHHFENKTGKYAIKGYPHKLGLLLYGPPGTGKTSLIKALAHHTKRHIVNVPLARIATNQDLMDIMFDQSFSVVKMDMPVALSYEHVIFVMEDIDAASPIVRSRCRVKSKKSKGRLRVHSGKVADRERSGMVVDVDVDADPDVDGEAEASRMALAKLRQEIQARRDIVKPDLVSLSGPTATPTPMSTASGLSCSQHSRGRDDGKRMADVVNNIDPHADGTGVDKMISCNGFSGGGANGSMSNLGSGDERLASREAGGGDLGEKREGPDMLAGEAAPPSTPLSPTSSSSAFEESVVVLSCAREPATEAAREAASEQDQEQSDRRKDEYRHDEEGAQRGIGFHHKTNAIRSHLNGRDDSGGRNRLEAVIAGGARLSSGNHDSSRIRGGRAWNSKDDNARTDYGEGDDDDSDDEDDEDDDDESDDEDDDTGGRDKGNDAVKEALVKSLGGKMGPRTPKGKKKYASKTDKLDLAGLLNVLDGVVETPGRIVIMTTNHPETLDPALIRPGRIDKRINLGYMKYPAALEMTRHFFEMELEQTEKERLREVCEKKRELTPATVEQLAGEHDALDDFLTALEALP